MSDKAYFSTPTTRHELKFVVPVEVGRSVMAAAARYCEKDPNTGPTGQYEVASLYYDTPQYRFYWDREESVGYRRKVRVRTYNFDGKAVACFAEIKQKYKQLIGKVRLKTGAQGLVLASVPCSDLTIERVLGCAPECPESREIGYLSRRLTLAPAVVIRYLRQVLRGITERDVRLTLDTSLTAEGLNGVLERRNHAIEIPLTPSNLGILEVKVYSQLPLWLRTILLNHELQRVKFSKYCVGMRALAADSRGTALSLEPR